MKIVSKYHVSIFYALREIILQRLLWTGGVGPGRVVPVHFFKINSANLKMVIRIYINFFRFFLKGLELFECRGDPYMTVNRNFVRFTDS